MVWALDLGTTNSALARWDEEADRPALVELPTICRHPGRVDPLEAPRMVPSSTHLLREDNFWGRLGRWRFFDKRVFWGTRAYIGRQAIERNQGWAQPCYAHSFKRQLATDPHQVLARVRNHSYTARQVAGAFMRELLKTASDHAGGRIRDLVVTTPVESYDTYRAEVRNIAERLGVERLRFVDEPVAAALGYGLSVGSGRRVLVVDFGGGTLDLALVHLNARDVEGGACVVQAKAGAPIGGNVVDRWLLEAFAEQLGIPLDPKASGEAALWYQLMLGEARRVKEAVYFKTHETFSITPPPEAPATRARLQGRMRSLDVTRDDVVAILEKREMYAVLQDCADRVDRQLVAQGLSVDAIDDVLMVGGSTLLPQVYAAFEARYGRDKVRAWQPFEAVALGACAYAAERFSQSDFIVHDYAFVTYAHGSSDPRYTTIVPRGTRFPTRPDLWKKQLVPTCALGVPEKMFKLVVCEVAGGDAEQKFAWDKHGDVHRVGGGQAQVVVPLNDSNPTLGFLQPPHAPGDTTPRLEIAFGVNANRWLCATITDLKTRKALMKDEPVVRIL